MKISAVNFLYFSPTGSTKKILNLIVPSFKIKPKFIDMTLPSSEKNELTFGKDDFVVFAFPVYSGRVPKIFNERLKDLKGNKTPCAVIATYGNREFDDAVIEMADIAKEAGFVVIGAMTAVTEHSVVRAVATGRPDAKDKAVIKAFGEAINKKLYEIDDIENFETPKLPGKRPYRKYIEIPMAPKTTSACIRCKACEKLCPVGAINVGDVFITDKNKCFGCMRCVRICPQKARSVGKLKMSFASFYMKLVCREDKKTEMFI